MWLDVPTSKNNLSPRSWGRPPAGEMEERILFTATQWECLTYLPLWEGNE